MAVDKKGCVSASGLLSVISNQSMTFTEQGEVETLIKDIDPDGDDKISYQEFVNLMTSK